MFRNKIDLYGKREVSTEEGMDLATYWKIPFIEGKNKLLKVC
jgi:hypothetical protein